MTELLQRRRSVDRRCFIKILRNIIQSVQIDQHQISGRLPGCHDSHCEHRFVRILEHVAQERNMDRRILGKQHQRKHILENETPYKSHRQASQKIREEKYCTEDSLSFSNTAHHQRKSKTYHIFYDNSHKRKLNGVDKSADKFLRMKYFNIVFQAHKRAVPVFRSFEVGTSPRSKGVRYAHDERQQDHNHKQYDCRKAQNLEPLFIILFHKPLPPFYHSSIPDFQ